MIWLERGAIRRDGDVQSVASEYLRTAIEHAGADLEARTDRVGTGALRFCRAELRTADGDPSVRVDAGGAASLVVTYSAPQELKDVVLELSVDSSISGRVTTLSTRSEFAQGVALPREGTIACNVPELPLNGGDYAWTLLAWVDGTVADWISDVAPFTVDATSFYPTAHHPSMRGGSLLLRSDWQLP